MFLKSIIVLVTLTITFEASFGLNSKLKIGTKSLSILDSVSIFVFCTKQNCW